MLPHSPVAPHSGWGWLRVCEISRAFLSVNLGPLRVLRSPCSRELPPPMALLKDTTFALPTEDFGAQLLLLHLQTPFHLPSPSVWG